MNNLIALDEGLIQILLQATPVGLCITDENGTFVAVNKAYADIYGYEPEEMLHRSFLMVVQERDREVLQRLHDEFIRGKEELDAFWTVVGKGGRLIEIQAQARRFVNSAGKVFKVTMVQDITQKRMLERRKNIAERMLFKEIALRLRSLREKVDSFDWASIRQRGSKIDYETEMKDVFETFEARLSGLKTLSEIIGGQFVPQKETVRLRDLWGRLQLTFQHLAANRQVGMRLVQECLVNRSVEDFTLRTDPALLKNILENLLKNALEASPPGTEVVLSARRTLNSFVIEITNDGEIPESVLPKFFQPYNTTKSTGSGLGAFSARMMVEALGGVIKAVSGNGVTTISIGFPVNVVVG